MQIIKDHSIGVIPVFMEAKKEPLFLLVCLSDGAHWAFPKGHQNQGESDEETAKRELYEETGIGEVELDLKKQFIQKYEYERDDEHFDKTVTHYMGHVSGVKTETPAEFRDEVIEIRWLSYEQALELATYESTKRILKEARDYLFNKGARLPFAQI